MENVWRLWGYSAGTIRKFQDQNKGAREIIRIIGGIFMKPCFLQKPIIFILLFAVAMSFFALSLP